MFNLTHVQEGGLKQYAFHFRVAQCDSNILASIGLEQHDTERSDFGAIHSCFGGLPYEAVQRIC
jgi:hypothetical protein